MLVILETILAFIVLIGILVFVHELGHFMTAKWCGMRADIFAIGMGPRVFGWNKHTGFSFGKLPEDLELGDDTDFRLSAFPVGGYVKIGGMVDESMDVDFAKHEPQPWEFRSKNPLQKSLVISAGVIMNFLLAIIVLASLNFIKGKEVINTTVVGPIPSESPATVAGMREGDKILKINGQKIESFSDVDQRIYLDEVNNDLKIDIERAGAPMTISIPRSAIKPVSDPSKDRIIPYPQGMTVLTRGVQKGSPAEKAGIQEGDQITSIDANTIATVDQMREYVSSHKQNTLSVTVTREGKPVTYPIKPTDEGMLGVSLEPKYVGPTKMLSYGFFAAIGSGVSETISTIDNITSSIVGIFKGKAKLKDSFGGPVMIAQMARAQAIEGLVPFLKLLAVLSISLGFINILPIPALDGGYLVFIIIEAVIRREVPIKIRMAVQQVGVALLLLFMGFVIFNDGARLFGK